MGCGGEKKRERDTHPNAGKTILPVSKMIQFCRQTSPGADLRAEVAEGANAHVQTRKHAQCRRTPSGFRTSFPPATRTVHS